MTGESETFDELAARIRTCRVCESALPLGPRPVIRGLPSARLLIVGQAPGTKVHKSGIPWDDDSGNRLRSWLDLDRERFYREDRIAVMPMGFCYPGRAERGGDLPPRRECAPLWHPPLLARFTQVRLTLLVGSYAQRHYLKDATRLGMTETVRRWRDFAPFLPLPHPSWRNTAWLRRNPWFEQELVPDLRDAVRAAFLP